MNLDRTYTLDSKIALKDNVAKLTIQTRIGIDTIGYFEEAPSNIIEIVLFNEQYGANTRTSRFIYNNTLVATLYHDEGKIEFHYDFPYLLKGEDNITIEFETQDFPTVQTKKLLAYADRILVMYDTANDMVMYSDYNELGYFPLSNYIKIGVNAAYPIGDSIVALFTDNGVSYLKRNTLTLAENKVKYAFSLIIGKPGTTAVAENAITTLANDVLFLSKTGVYALSFGDNVTSNERFALERSAFINAKLSKENNLDKAISINHDNRYYLAIDGSVYIADARYKTSPRDQDMNDTFNYEWWYWDNIPVKEFFTYNNKLYFINANGRICEFVEERADEDILMLSYYNQSRGYITAVGNDTYYFQIDMNYLDWIENGNILYQTQRYSVKKYEMYDVSKYNGRFKLREYNTGNEVTNDIYFFGFDETVDSSGQIQRYKQVFIARKKNVKSEWYTPVVNMGTSLYSKNLIGSTLTFEPDIEGNVKFGYLTRRSGEPKDKVSNLNATNGVDFEDVDFTDFSFNVGFACSRTLKTRVRNYNYIQFRVVSDNNKDCALNNFVVTYTIGRKNKGVR